MKTTFSEEKRGKTMNEITQLADRYVAIWHEPDAEQRRRSVAQLWAEDGVQFTSWGEMRGHQALEKRVEAAHEEFVKTRGLLWRRSGDVHGHHDALSFTWEMVLAEGFDVAATGTIFLLLSEDGRIRLDYQFVEQSELLSTLLSTSNGD
jgi:uncharacterized protein